MLKPRPNTVQVALLLGLFTVGVLGLLLTRCSGSELPSLRLPPQVACGGELATLLPPDPDRVTLGDLKLFVREYRKCLRVADAGAE